MEDQGRSLVFLQYLTTVFDNIGDGIALMNIEPGDKYRLAMANKPFYEMTGYTEEINEKLFNEYVPPEGAAFLVRQYRKVMKTRRQVRFLRWADYPVGYRALDVRLVPILGTTGEVILIACIVQDATEREQMREEVERLRKTVRGIQSSK